MLDLKNCPFCGGEASVETDEDNYGTTYSVGCFQAGRCGVRFTNFDHEADAVAAWNRRASSVQAEPVAQVDDRMVEKAAPLDDCPVGLFLFNGHLGFMTEYSTLTKERFIQRDAYVVESGEYYWGGTATAEARAKLLVQPINSDRLTAALAEREPVADAVKPLDDNQIMEVIKECFPWKDEPKINDLLTYEKSPPLFPQATYDVPSYRATKFVRAIEQRIRSALVATPPAERMKRAALSDEVTK